MASKSNRLIIDIAQGTILAAKSAEHVADVLDDLLMFKKLLNNNPEMVGILSNPGMTLDDRYKVIKKTLDGKINEISLKLLYILIEKNLLRNFNDFYDMVVKNAKDMANFHLCQVTSAVTLSEKYRKKIKEALTKKFNGSVQIEYNIDPNVIGGLAISCGDWRYLGTVQAKLQQLSRHLITS